MAVSAPERHDRGRRSLLRGRSRTPPALRPPWALDESRFVDACTGCGKCVAACPEQVLVRGEGGLPVFDPHLGECSFCGDCAAACGDAAFAAIDVVCWSCRDACGETAIRFPLTRAVPAPQVLDERCTGCGACVPACPSGAISLLAASGREEAADA